MEDSKKYEQIFKKYNFSFRDLEKLTKGFSYTDIVIEKFASEGIDKNCWKNLIKDGVI